MFLKVSVSGTMNTLEKIGLTQETCQVANWVHPDDEINFSSLNMSRHCCTAKIRRLDCPCLP